MGEVMQFLYGEDGMEGTTIESQRMEFLRYNRRKFAEVGGWLVMAGSGSGREGWLTAADSAGTGHAAHDE